MRFSSPWIQGLMFFAVMTLTTGCHQQKKATGPMIAGPPEVVVSRAVQSDVRDYEEFTGRTDANKTVFIRSRVTGYLDRVCFHDGEEVKKGQLLFEIDPRHSKANFDAFDAALLQTEAHLKRLEDDYRRAKNLFGTKALSREEYDKTVGDRAEAEAAVRKARADRLMASVDLAYCSIKSPISGRVSRSSIDPHNLVKADDTILTSIVAIDPIYAYFDVDERTFQRLNRLAIQADEAAGSSPGQTVAADADVEIGLAGEEGYPHRGVLNFRDNLLDAGTGTMRYRCEIPNPKREFVPNMFVRVRLPIGTPRAAVLVPEQAIGTDQGQKFIYVVDDLDDVVYRPVKVGALQGRYRVIHEGINPRERVVSSGLQRVRPGIRVKPTEDVPAALPAKK